MPIAFAVKTSELQPTFHFRNRLDLNIRAYDTKEKAKGHQKLSLCLDPGRKKISCNAPVLIFCTTLPKQVEKIAEAIHAIFANGKKQEYAISADKYDTHDMEMVNMTWQNVK